MLIPSPYRLVAILFAGTLLAPVWAQAPASRVVMSIAAERTINPTVTVVGTVEFGRTADVSSEISGRIESIPIESGQLVRRGEVLARINTDFFTKDIEIIRSESREIEVQLLKQRSILKRREALIRNNATSQDAYDDAFYTVQELERRLETARQRIERLELSISKSAVRAPFDGVVLEKHREVGEALGAQAAVARIASSREIDVAVAISQDLLRFQEIGRPVKVFVEALNRHLDGRFQRVEPVADLRSKNVRMKIRIPYQADLIQNMTARLEIPSGESRTVTVVKRDAIVRMQGNDFVYTVDDGKARMLPITIVTRLGDEVAVSGPQVEPGLAVVIDGNQRLRPDQAVAVVDAPR